MPTSHLLLELLHLEDMLLPLEKFTPEHLQGHKRLVSVRQPTFTHAKDALGMICCLLYICTYKAGA